MGVTLQQALANHRSLLGANYENVGKRVYLSYESGKGWSIENFTGCWGFVKGIFRSLGFYASTHLKCVATQIQRETGVPAPLLAKVNGCWQKRGGAIAAPPPQPLPEVREAVARAVPDRTILNRMGVYVGETLISLEQGDVTRAKVAAIVNAAKNSCLGGSGVDAAVHMAAGPALLEECRRLVEILPGVRCETGRAVMTGSGNLAEKGILRVIHTVGPVYNPYGPAESRELLKSAYLESLEIARRNGIRTIAFPAISTGIYGFPFAAATKIAVETIEEYVVQYPRQFNEIKLVFFGDSYGAAAAVYNSFPHPNAIRDNFLEF